MSAMRLNTMTIVATTISQAMTGYGSLAWRALMK